MPKNIESPVATDTTLTLTELQSALGEPDPAAAAAILEGATEAELVALGRRIASRHILSDARRIYAAANDFWGNASPVQRNRLRGFSPGLLAVAVWRAERLEEMAAGHDDRADAQGADRDSRDRESRMAFDNALVLRDQAYRVLRGVAGRDAQRLGEVDAAVGTAESSEKLAAGVERLAALGGKWLSAKKGPAAERARLMRLDQAYVDELTAAATRLKKAADKSTARSGGKAVTQGALDAEDGANLMLLGHVVEVFEAAHDVDPTIPRLAPIATRRLLKPSSAQRKGPSKEGAAPEEAAPTKVGGDNGNPGGGSPS